MIIQVTRAIDTLGMKSLGKARVETDNICFYERVQKITGLSPETKEEFTLIVFKGGDNLCVKETPEELDKMIDPRTYYVPKKEIERGNPFELKDGDLEKYLEEEK